MVWGGTISLYSCCHCPLTCHSLSPQSHSLSPGGNWVNRKRMRHAQVGLVPQWTHRSALDVGDAGDFAMQSFLRRKPEAVGGGGALMTCFSFRSWKQWVIIWSRAEFEGLFSLTNRERQNINYRFRKKTLHKIYKLHSMLLSEINIWSPSKTLLSAWWRNQYLRTSWSSGLHITEEGFWSTPLYRNSLNLLKLKINSLHTFSVMCFPFPFYLGGMFWIIVILEDSSSVFRLRKGGWRPRFLWPQSSMFPCLTVWMVFFMSYSAFLFLQTWRINLMPKSLIFHLWCHLTTALLPSLLWLI